MADLPLDQQYIDAVKGFEGFTPRAQWDVNNHRNGYGTNALYPTEVIDKDEATNRLHRELGSAGALVDGQFPDLTPGRKAALTSLTFNAGPKWMGEGLGNAVRAGDWDTAKQHLLNYNHSAGVVNAGLTKRRAAEAAWLDGGDTGPMAEATGSIPQTTAPRGGHMATPMDEASSPGILDRITNGLQAAQNNGVGDTLQNVGAWLMARDNPAGGAALLAGLKKDKNTGEWSHQIDTNTGQIISVHNKTGKIMTTPIPGYNPNKAADEARLKEEGKADVELDTKLGDEGRALGARRESLNQAKDILGNLKGGLANADQIVKLKQLGNQMGITNFQGVPDAQVAATIANRLALEAQNQGGTRLLPGSMSDSDRKFISAMAANPTNDPEANKRILEIADKALQREEAASKIHLGMMGSGFTRKGFNAAIDNLDKQRAAEAAASQAAAPQQPTTAPPPLSSFKF